MVKKAKKMNSTRIFLHEEKDLHNHHRALIN